MTSPSYNIPRASNHIQYHGQLEQLKQRIASNEKKMEEDNPQAQVIQKPVVHHNFRPTPMSVLKCI